MLQLLRRLVLAVLCRVALRAATVAAAASQLQCAPIESSVALSAHRTCALVTRGSVQVLKCFGSFNVDAQEVNFFLFSLILVLNKKILRLGS